MTTSSDAVVAGLRAKGSRERRPGGGQLLASLPPLEGLGAKLPWDR